MPPVAYIQSSNTSRGASIHNTDPFDTIKVRLQTGMSSGTQPMTTYSCVVDTIKHEGILAIYKGMATPLLLTGIVNSIMFGLLHASDQYIVTPLRGSHTSGSTLNTAISGTLSGVCIAVIVTPMELIKSRLQVNRSKYNVQTPLQFGKQIVNQSGVLGLYRGFTSVVLTRGSNYSYFGGYCVIKQYILSKHVNQPNHTNQLSMFESIVCGGSAGVIYWLSCYQFDTIKAQMMTQPADKQLNIVQTGKQIYHNGGISAFYRGFLPCVVRAIPANAAAFSTFELVMRLLPE